MILKFILENSREINSRAASLVRNNAGQNLLADTKVRSVVAGQAHWAD